MHAEVAIQYSSIMSAIQSVVAISCPLCHAFQAPTLSLLWPRIRLIHATQPGFHIRCNMDSCSRTFTNMKTYDNHLSRCHFMHSRNDIPQMFITNVTSNAGANSSEKDSDESANIHDDPMEDSMDTQTRAHSTDNIEEELKHTAACWILKLVNSQSATDEIIQGVTSFNSYILSKVYNIILKA